jgi:hypothetical protein
MRMTAEVMVRGITHEVVVDCSAFRGRVSIQVDGQSVELPRYYSLPGSIEFSLAGVPAKFRLEQTGFANAQCGIETEGRRFELVEPGDRRDRKRRALVAEGGAVLVLGLGALAYDRI